MRIVYIDIDSLRPDHLHCYGYHRNTSPNIDRVAQEGVVFTNCYTSDAPCAPSRTALFSGQFGIHNGLIDHGGTAGDVHLIGEDRGFTIGRQRRSWMSFLRAAGIYTVSVSSFAERHSAWHFYDGFNEIYNPGKGGFDIADDVTPFALKWMESNAEKDNWFLHVNYWDPHTPYRTPEKYGNPFEEDPISDWISDEIIEEHYKNSCGWHSAFDVDYEGGYPRVPKKIKTVKDYKKWIDGYDTGIWYVDKHIGCLMDMLSKKGVLDEVIVIISADHGENQGELNVYGDHQTADQCTSNIPLIIKGPRIKKGVKDNALIYNLDLPPTLAGLIGETIPNIWDGIGFGGNLIDGVGDEIGRKYLVCGQGVWTCQRAVRFKDYILIRTYHGGLRIFPDYMLFNIKNDPHECYNLSDKCEDLVNEGIKYLGEWHFEMMSKNRYSIDPMWTVIREGGPHCTRKDAKERYCKILRQSGRKEFAEIISTRCSH